ncbi:MAG: PAS domain-containing protein [Planctomycetes bacterium]|nr:PAS domain-containing protein [Planctomycetota bacterium]
MKEKWLKAGMARTAAMALAALATVVHGGEVKGGLVGVAERSTAGNIVVAIPYPTQARGIVAPPDSAGAERIGFAREITREAAAAVAKTVTFIELKSENGENLLASGHVDAVAGLSVFVGRLKQLSFTSPLMLTRGSLWVPKGWSGDTSTAGLRKMRIAVALDGVAHQWGLEQRMHLEAPGSLVQAFELVRSGGADGVVTTQAAGRWEVEQQGWDDLEEHVVDDSRLSRAFAIAVRAEDRELLADLNRGLATLRDSGRFDELYERYVEKYQPRELPARLDWQKLAIVAAALAALVIASLAWVLTLRRQLDVRTKELRASEMQYRTLTENIPGIVYSYLVSEDGSRKILYESPGVKEWTEWYSGLHVGKDYTQSILTQIHLDDRARYEEAVKRSRADLSVFDVEYRMTDRLGDIRWVHSIVRPIVHPDGVEWQGLSLDVTPVRLAEQARGETELRFREIFDRSHDAIVVFDAETEVILEANQRALEMYGYTLDELRGERLEILCTQGSLTARGVREMLSQHARCEFITQRRKSDGSLVHVEVAASLIRVRGRDAVLSMGRDVGARIAAEEALKASEQRYRDFVIRSAEAVFRIENRNPIAIDASVRDVVEQFVDLAVITECNDAMAAMFDCREASELTGVALKKVLDLNDPVNRELVQRFVSGGLRLVDAEARRLDSNGNERWFRVSMVGHIENGEFVRVWGIQREETQQKLAQSELADAQARLAAAVAGAGVCTWRLDLDSEQIDADESYLSFFGFPKGSRPTRLDFLAQVHPEDRKIITIAIERAIRGGVPYAAEYRMLSRDTDGVERIRWVSSRGTLQRDERGRPISLTGASTEITDAKHAAEERERFLSQLQKSQKLESLGVMAGGVAHDFNNILVGILGSAGLAMSQVAAGENAMETLETIERSAIRAADLTKQLLAYSGRGRVVTTSLCMTELVRECAELLTIAAGSSCRVVRDLGNELPLVSADPTQLFQVVLNLVRNAAEALPATGGEITICTSLVDIDASRVTELSGAKLQPGKHVCLSVSDNGSGMTAETRSRIFEPFFTTKFTGRGLGLSSVLGIIQAHGGAVSVRSEIRRGTTFEVFLPALQSSLSPAKPLALAGWGQVRREQFVEARETSQSRALVGEGTILVVDDEKLVRDLVCAVLRYAGYRVESAHDGFKALELIKADESICLTVLDMTMPTISGEETMRLIQVIRPRMAFLLSSGFCDAMSERLVQHGGLVRFLAKPYRNQELTEAVASLLGSAGLERLSVSA